jgi:hypothetical protein
MIICSYVLSCRVAQSMLIVIIELAEDGSTEDIVPLSSFLQFIGHVYPSH